MKTARRIVASGQSNSIGNSLGTSELVVSREVDETCAWVVLTDVVPTLELVAGRNKDRRVLVEQVLDAYCQLQVLDTGEGNVRVIEGLVRNAVRVVVQIVAIPVTPVVVLCEGQRPRALRPGGAQQVPKRPAPRFLALRLSPLAVRARRRH